MAIGSSLKATTPTKFDPSGQCQVNPFIAASRHQAQKAANCKYEVYMRCVTWSRDSHGLFDYESKNIAKKNIKT
jgi:hypothetical protein